MVNGLIGCWPPKFWYNWLLFLSGVFLFVLGTGFLVFFCKRMFLNNYPKYAERMDTVYHKKSTARRMDLTVGQQLLGHDRTHSAQLSSTPLEDREQVRFHFETPAILV